MVTINGSFFKIDTSANSLLLRIDENHHLVNEYYGRYFPNQENYQFVVEKTAFPFGSSVVFSKNHPSLSLDQQNLEYSSFGKGDYRQPAIILSSENEQVFDFVYDSHQLIDEPLSLEDLPTPHQPDQLLKISLLDQIALVRLNLYYWVFEKSNIIARHIVIINESNDTYQINKLMSLQLDLNNDQFNIFNLYGGWAAENHLAKSPLNQGIYINDSKTGNSSNRHNPFFILANQATSLNNGSAYGFNFLYSGNHYEMVELTSYQKVRIQIGINPLMFNLRLRPQQHFETPVAIMSYSNDGLNGLSFNMHQFVNYHLIRGPWSLKQRPILINNWEATYFKFTEPKLVAIMKKAASVGIELFVLDDGWFSNRNDDTKGLGDYDVNKKKLPRGLSYLAKKANKLGLKFGLWFEPEMVNENSKLYAQHPDWAIKCLNREPSLGRNQLVLDLSKVEVQDYLISSISNVLDSAHIEYVKWDMNRHISDYQSLDYQFGHKYHAYIKGLYRVLKTLTSKYDYILWEGCSSGGNRFDLGILAYMQQIWTSDNTDAYERIIIQSGTAFAYPLSAMTAHVSGAPSHQPLRVTPLETRFNVAAFANLGYELNLANLGKLDTIAIKNQIAFYKKHRQLFQYGRFYQLKEIKEDGFASWMVINDNQSEALIGFFNGLQSMLPQVDILPAVSFINDASYHISVRQQRLKIKTFGGLINHVSPILLNENGLIANFLNKNVTIEQLMKVKQRQPFIASGAALNSGAVKLLPQWAGTGFSEKTRVLLDFGSEIYHIKQIT